MATFNKRSVDWQQRSVDWQQRPVGVDEIKDLGSEGDIFETFHSSDITFSDLTKFFMKLEASTPEIVLLADLVKYIQYNRTIFSLI